MRLYNDNLQSLIYELKFSFAIDYATLDKLPFNRQCIQKNDVLASLRGLFEFIQFVKYCYGANYIARTFDENLIPTHIDKRKNVRYNVHKGVRKMLNTNVTNFRSNIYSLLEQTIKYNELCNVSTKDGNVIVMSEADYRDIMETIAVLSDEQLHEKLTAGKNTSLDECLPESGVIW